MSGKQERRKMFNKIITGSKGKKSSTSKDSGKTKKDAKTTTPVVSEGSNRTSTPVESISTRKRSKTPESDTEVSGEHIRKLPWEISEDVTGM